MGGKEKAGSLYPIGAVARKTGLSPHVLRAWERRYGVVAPERAEGGTRLYGDADVVRLRLLKRVTEAGHPIGRVAASDSDELLALLRDVPTSHVPVRGFVPRGLISECLEAVEAMDGARVHAVLMRAVVILGAARFLEDLVVPLLHRVGELWETGSICPAHEHLFSAAVQRVLGWMMEQVGTPGAAPVLVATTPAGQRHEIGAMLSGVVAAEEGWRVEYLGPDLSARDIARAVATTQARAVALSIVREVNEMELLEELEELREQIAGDVSILVGGRGVREHEDTLSRAGVLWLADLATLRVQLQGLRSSIAGE